MTVWEKLDIWKEIFLLAVPVPVLIFQTKTGTGPNMIRSQYPVSKSRQRFRSLSGSGIGGPDPVSVWDRNLVHVYFKMKLRHPSPNGRLSKLEIQIRKHQSMLPPRKGNGNGTTKRWSYSILHYRGEFQTLKFEMETTKRHGIATKRH